MQNILAVAAGGSIGAVLRYGISELMRRVLPGSTGAGTLVVNVLGCLVIGFLSVAAERSQLSPETRLFLMTGMLGALTTFSTFGLETTVLARETGMSTAVFNVLANLIFGFAAVLIGIKLAGGFR